MANNHNLTPWKPGQSGNPKGKPKGSRNLRKILRERLEDNMVANQPTPDGRPNEEWVIDSLIAGAIKGNPAHISIILAYDVGKPTEAQPEPQADGMPMMVDVIGDAERRAMQHKQEIDAENQSEGLDDKVSML